MRRTFDYYDPLTTGDSTLSACVQSVVASAVGYADAALGYFLDALDRRPARHARQHGRRASTSPPAAGPGSRWSPASAACATRTARLRFAPRLPEGWERLRFRIAVRGQQVEVDMTPGATTYSLLEGTRAPARAPRRGAAAHARRAGHPRRRPGGLAAAA